MNIDYVLLAYIDPGTGALVLQVLAAAALTLGVGFRRVLTAPFRYFIAKMNRPGCAVREDEDAIPPDED